MNDKRLTPRREALLREALRRWRMRPKGDHTGGETLTTAWTGLGSATPYKPATDAGLMECATQLNPGHSTWWRLTDAGAVIVRGWLSLYECAVLDGLELDHHESDLYLKDCPEARVLLEEHDKRGVSVRKVDGWNVSVFYSQTEREPWLDIPFAYGPAWPDTNYGPNGRATGRRSL